jgi:hypothetical protein
MFAFGIVMFAGYMVITALDLILEHFLEPTIAFELAAVPSLILVLYLGYKIPKRLSRRVPTVDTQKEVPQS